MAVTGGPAHVAGAASDVPVKSLAAASGAVRVPAPAKINLYLHVTGRRADGYHELDSLVAFASVHDRVSVSPSDGLTLETTGSFASSLVGALAGNDDLVLRAARRLADHLRPARRGAALHLEKHLPIASGLGGGSADAAAALLALNQLWSLGLTFDELAEIGLTLGADVPMCLASRPLFAGGIGERLTDAPVLPPLGILLVNPQVPVPTAEVFRALAGRFGPAARPSYRAGDTASLLAALGTCRNDLTAPAIASAPAIGEVLKSLEALPQARLARMSGSGATCFALFHDQTAAETGANSLRSAHPGWWVAAGRLIGGRDDLAI